METTVLERKKNSPFITAPRGQDEALTYEKIGRMKAAQDILIAEGKMMKPQVVKGFSAEGRMNFEGGIRLEDYIKLKGF